MSELEWLEMFGKNLKRIMKDSWVSQKELADAIGVSEATLSNYVNGRSMPTARSILNISYELSCDSSDLIDFGEPIE